MASDCRPQYAPLSWCSSPHCGQRSWRSPLCFSPRFSRCEQVQHERWRYKAPAREILKVMLSWYVSFVADTMDARIASAGEARDDSAMIGTFSYVRFFIEDCAEPFLVIAQPPAVPLREVGDFGLTWRSVGRPRSRQLRFVYTAMFRFP
jgi:hypothetical protein